MNTTTNNPEKADDSQNIATYRKGSFEAKIDSLLPEGDCFDVIAHELWRESEGGWSVNDSWKMARSASREEAISVLRHRWEIFKLNYLPKARVCDLTDLSYGDGNDALLEVDCTAFAEVRLLTPDDAA